MFSTAWPTPPYQLWFAFRYVHIASQRCDAGGRGLWHSGWSRHRVLTTIASASERTFWLPVGIVAAIGVSNVGPKGDGVLGPGTS